MTTTFDSAAALGLPAFPSGDGSVLGFPAMAPTQGYLVQPRAGEAVIDGYSLIFDLLVPTDAAGDYGALFQTSTGNGDDGDFFLKKLSATTAGIGIGGQYDGEVTLGAWHRVALTIENNGDGTATLKKFIDGAKVGEQSVEMSRYALDRDSGFLILADNDGETFPGLLNSFLFTDKTLAEGDVAALGGADVNGILSLPPGSGHATQFDFDGEAFVPTFGEAAMTARETMPSLGAPAEFGAPALPGADSGVIGFPAAAPNGGYLIDPGLPGAAVAQYTLVFDLLIPADAAGTYGALLQTDVENGGDGDFFLKKLSATTAGIGIGGQYDGEVTLGAWHRVALTVENNGDGTAILKKFIDGEKVGEQSVDAGRFTIDGDKGFLILTDENGETFPGYLNGLLFTDEVLSEDAIQDLGGATADGILSVKPDTGHATQFDFNDGTLAPTFGEGTMTDRADPGSGEDPVAIASPIKDYLVTPDAETVTIDLSEVFAGEGLTYSVENADGAVVAVSEPVDGLLTLDFGGFGFSDVKVTAADAEGNTVTDWFRVRVAGPNAYTIAVLPDTQDYTDNAALSPTFGKMTQWLADNAADRNLQFVVHVGDVTQNNVPEQWQIAQDAMSKLDGIVPYSVLPGNHDQGSGGSANNFDSLISEYFPIEKYQGEGGTLGGVYDGEPGMMNNNYHTFTAPDGTKWLVLSLEFGARDDVMRWAGEVIESHLDHRVIVANHNFTNFPGRSDPLAGPLFAEGAGYNYGLVNSAEGANDGETMWREFVGKYPNVSFVFSGHVFGDGAETHVGYSDYGTPVYQMTVNYQNGVSQETAGGNGGNGAIRLLTIDPDNNTVWTETYFAGTDEYLTGYRDEPEYDRDGLTGAYREHQETIENIDVGAPTVYAKAKAGDDQFVAAEEGDAAASVTLDASGSIDPKGEIVSYVWTDAEGRVVATGKTVQVELVGGRHDLTLTTTDVNGVTNSDTVRVVVSTDKSLLLDNFNDGDLDGWSSESASQTVEDLTDFGDASDFDVPALPGGETDVMAYARTTPFQAYQVKPGFAPSEGGQFTQYSMVFDMYVPNQAGTFGVFFQTNLSNGDDGDAFIRKTSDTGGGIGISGVYEGNFTFDQWHRVAFTFEDQGSSLVMRKYIDGVKVGEQTVSAGRYAIDAEKGFLILTDEDGETWSGYLSSFLFTDKLLSDAEIAALGGPDAGGILDAAPDGANATQFDFADGSLAPSFGSGSLSYVDFQDDPARATWKVKGTVASQPQQEEALPAPEGALYEFANSDRGLVWADPDAKGWSDYVLDVSVQSQDDDTIGVYVYYQDANNHYKLTLDTEKNERVLAKVKDGVETVLARVEKGYPFNAEMNIRVAVVGNQIFASLDGRDLFGGPVLDAADPLTGGTIGLISINQYQSIFDDVIVNAATLTAHAGTDQRLVDVDGDGTVAVSLNATGSFGPNDIVSYVWRDGDTVLATGKTATIQLPVGTHDLTLTVVDETGTSRTDTVTVDAVGKDRVLLSDGFGDGDTEGWRIVDEGELGDAADWTVTDGRLVQNADTYSRELAPDSETPGVWRNTWSPLGDGWHVLRKGTYALYDSDEAYAWEDYAVEATVNSPEKGAVGILFHYQDANNYYKLELDSDDRFIQLICLEDGIEQSLALTRNSFALNSDLKIRVEVRDNRIQAYLDGEAIFAYPIEDRSLTAGTVALYSWGSEGVRFDDVTVLDLAPAAETRGVELVGTGRSDELTGGAGDDRLEGLGGDDLLASLAGADRLYGGSGNDDLDGGDGDDQLEGGDHRDRLAGGDGDDILDGGAHEDELEGGEGDDVLAGGSGHDRLDGGDGDDILDGGSGADEMLGGTGDDWLDGGDGNDTLLGAAGDDHLDGGLWKDRLEGGAGDDVLLGGSHNDHLEGGEGDDQLDGGSGHDRLYDGAGDDVVEGGGGMDEIFAGAGSDSFLFRPGSGHDRLYDFGAEDVIELIGYGFDSFEDVLAASRSLVEDTRIVLDEDASITLVGITLNDLQEDDFRLA